MKKSWCVYWILLIAAAVPTAAAMLAPWYIGVSAGVLYILLLLWWSLFYYKLEYWRQEKTICIKSGAFFVKRRVIPVDNILWEMRLSAPIWRGTVLSVLHTAGGAVVIFADFSTEC